MDFFYRCHCTTACDMDVQKVCSLFWDDSNLHYKEVVAHHQQNFAWVLLSSLVGIPTLANFSQEKVIPGLSKMQRELSQIHENILYYISRPGLQQNAWQNRPGHGTFISGSKRILRVDLNIYPSTKPNKWRLRGGQKRKIVPSWPDHPVDRSKTLRGNFWSQNSKSLPNVNKILDNNFCAHSRTKIQRFKLYRAVRKVFNTWVGKLDGNIRDFQTFFALT